MGMGQELNDFASGFKTGFSLGDKYNARKDNMAIAAGYESRADYDKAQKIKAAGGDPSSLKNPNVPRDPTTPTNTGSGGSNEGGEGSSDGHKANSGDAQADLVLDKIRPIEGGTKDPYNTALAHQKVGRLTGMTAQQWLDDAYPKVKGAARVMGAYQFKDSTLRGLIEKGKLDASTVMTPNVQDQMGLELMKGRGWNDFKAGKISAQQFMGNMSQEWASLPDPNNGGRSHYKNEHLGISLNAFGKVLDSIKGGATSSGQGGDQSTADGSTKAAPADTSDTSAPTTRGIPTTPTDTSSTDASVKPTAASNFGKNLLSADEAQKRRDAGDTTITTADVKTPAQQTSAIPQRSISGGGPTATAMASAKENLASYDEGDDSTDDQGQKRQMPQSRGAPQFEVAQLDPTTPLGAPSVQTPTGPILGPLPPPSVGNPSGVYGVGYAARGGLMQSPIPRRQNFAGGGATAGTANLNNPGVPTNANQQGSGRSYTQAIPASTAGPAPTQAAWTPRMIGQVAPGGGQNQPATSGSQAKFAAAQQAVQDQITARNAAAAQAPVQAQVDQGPFSHQAYIQAQQRHDQAVAPQFDQSTPPNRFRDAYQAPRPYMDEASWQQMQPGYQQWYQQNNPGKPVPGYNDGGFVGGFASGLESGVRTGRGIADRRSRRAAKSGISTDSSTSTDSADGGSYNRGYTPDSDDTGSYNRGTVDAAGGGLMKGYGQKSSTPTPDDDDRKDRADRKSPPRSDDSRPPAGSPYREGGTGTVDKGTDYDPQYSTMGGGGPSPAYEPNDYDAKPSGMTMPELHELGDIEDRRRRAASGIPLAHRNVSSAAIPGTNNTAEPHQPDFPTPEDPGYKHPVNEEYDTDRKPSDIVSSGPELADMTTTESARRRAALPRDQDDRETRSSRAAALARLEARDKAYAKLEKTQGDRATRAGTEDQPTTPESTAQDEEGAGKIPTPPPRPADIDQPPTPPTPPVRRAQAPSDGSPAPSPIPTPPPRPAILGGVGGAAPAAQGQTPSQITPDQPAPDQPAVPTPPTTPVPPVPQVDDYGRPVPDSTLPPDQPAVPTPPTTPVPPVPQVDDYGRPVPDASTPPPSPIPTPSIGPTPALPGKGPGQAPAATGPIPRTPSQVGEAETPPAPPPAKPGTKVKQPGIVTHKEVQESTKAGLGSINKGIGQAGSFNKGFGVPDRSNQGGTLTAAQRSFANNDNAIDPKTMANLKQQVDPDNKLGEAEKMMKVQQDLYDFYMSHGYQTKAAGVAAGVLMYGRRISQLAGNMAQAALEHGDTATASAWMAKAYANMPDGHELRVSKPDAKGNVQYQLVDLETGEAGEIKTATPDDMLTMAKSMSSGALWATSTINIAQGTGVGVGGGGVGKGRGGGGTRQPGALTENQKLTQDEKAKKSDLMDGFNDAVDKFKADPSDENKAAAQKAAQDALAAGNSSSNVNLILKQNGLAVTAPGKPTQKEQDKSADDDALNESLKDAKNDKEKAAITSEHYFNNKIRDSKRPPNDKNLTDEISTVDPQVEGLANEYASSIAEANNLTTKRAVTLLHLLVSGADVTVGADGKVTVKGFGQPVYLTREIVQAVVDAQPSYKAE
jgi:hypothetical protein